MLDFARTPMGRAFFESTLPRIATALEKIATRLDEKEERERVELARKALRCAECGCRFTVHSHQECAAWNCPHCDCEVKA